MIPSRIFKSKRAFVGATVYTGERILEQGSLLIQDDRILAVAEHLDPPSDAEIVDLRGKVLLPGLVEVHSHLIAHDWGDEAEDDAPGAGRLPAPITPDIDYYYHLDPLHPDLEYARAGGVTTVAIIPGSGRVITGTGIVIKTAGKNREELLLERHHCVKVALGENPKRAFGVGRKAAPMTRMGSAALFRETLLKAQDYARAKERAQKNGTPFAQNTQLEPLLPLLRGEVLGRMHAHRADDIMTVIRLSEEFGFRISIEHTTTGHLIVNELARRQIPCIVGPTFGARGKEESRLKSFTTPGILDRAGILVAVTTDASVLAIELLRLCASLAWREGMSEISALKTITLNPARILEQDTRVGSLATGKDADFLILDGKPFSLRSSILETWLNGNKVYDRATFVEPYQRDYPW